MSATLSARHEIYDLQSFEATEPIPELGIEPGDWVDIDLASPFPLSVSHGPRAVEALCRYVSQRRAGACLPPLPSTPSPASSPPLSPDRRLARYQLFLLR